MLFRVIITDTFSAQLQLQIDYLRDQHAGHAVIENWFNDLLERLASLELSPMRYEKSEKASVLSGKETRKMTYGDYLIFYQVDEIKRTVEIQAICHGSRKIDRLFM